MKLAGLAAALALLIAAGAAAAVLQARPDTGVGESAIQRGMRASEATNRITVLLSQTLGDRAIIEARSPQSLADAITTRSAAIAAARAELTRINAELSALHPLADTQSQDVLARSVDNGTRETADLARKADDILATLQTMPDAVRSGDRVRFIAAARALSSGAVVLKEAEALHFREQASRLDPDNVQHAESLALACLADGQAAAQAGIGHLRERVLTVRQVTDAETCVRNQIVRGRARLGDPSTAGGQRAQLAPVDASFFDVMSDAADLLGGVKDALARNDDEAIVSVAVDVERARIQSRIQDLMDRRNRIIAAEG